MGCYDRIIRPQTILNSRTFCIPEDVCQLDIKAHNKMKYKNQINNKVSDIVYKSTDKIKMHGAGQGADNGGTH